MAFTATTPLNKLNPSKIRWEIQVRAQAVWKGITRDTKEFRGMNVLFIDDSNTRIHAFINARISPMFEPSLEEGQLYRVSSFTVHLYTGFESHRCVRTEHHIYFSDYTRMQKITSSIPRIPEYSFDLFDLLSLGSTPDEKRFLFDVIGVMNDREPILKYVNELQQEKIQVKFSLTDGRCTRKVTFFDELAIKFDKALEKQFDGPVVVIIGSAKIGQYQGELNISNYPVTRFYINVDHFSVRKMRLRALDPSFKKKVVEITEERPVDSVTSVSCIKGLKEDYIERRVRCLLKIEKVEELQWFYHICPKCSEELVALDGRFKCSKYQRYIPYPERRFRITTICSDGSGVIVVLLGDCEVRGLIKKNVFEVDLENAKGDTVTQFPSVFKEIVGKSYFITVKISKENVQNNSEVYESADIEEVCSSIQVPVPNTDPSEQTDDSCLPAGTVMDGVVEEGTPETGVKSVTKDKMRKIVNVVSPEVADGEDDVVLLDLLSGGKTKKSKK